MLLEESISRQIEQAKVSYGPVAEDFLLALRREIPAYFAAGLGLLREHQLFVELCSEAKFATLPVESVAETVSYCLLLKQYELIDASVRSLLSNDYVVCATLLRSIFEANMILMHLNYHSDDADDFVAFSEISCSPDVDWSAHGISRTKREDLEKKFSIRKLIRNLYKGTQNEQQRIHHDQFYQQLCNATHPSLETSSYFYRYGAPPSREYSSIGIRRTLIQLWGVTNSTIEHVSGTIYKSKRMLDECYARRDEIYICHNQATAWHAHNPTAMPVCTRNQEFRIGWKEGRPVIACVEGHA